MTSDSKTIILGAGPIAIEYFNLLKEFEVDTIVIGRGEKTAKDFEKATGTMPLLGGVEQHASILSDNSRVIIAVSEDQLGNVLKNVLELNNQASVLIEKPGALTFDQLESISKKYNMDNVHIAYNRRFFSSVSELKERLADEGCISFNFEFTEWGHVIEGIKKNPSVKENWFWHNSSHVVDLAFFLGGKPVKMHSMSKGELSWHPAASNFVGCGESETGAFFSYQANWEGPGRWGLEFITPINRYYLRPMEALQVQAKGTVKIDPVEIDDSLDKKWKPGFYLQTKCFLDGDNQKLCSFNEQVEKNDIYRKILNGEK